jgi:RNA polymerase sigma factor (sigma-70 family)
MWIEDPHPDPLPQAGEGTKNDAAPRAAAVQRLFEAHNRKLIRFLLTRLHDEQDAVEVAQEAYVQLLQLEKSGSAGLLQAYLFKIARNLAVDRVRRRKVRSEHVQAASLDGLFDTGVEEGYLAGEQLKLFWRAVEELPEKCRAAFMASKFRERTAEEVAGEMKISARMVRKYIVQGLVYCRLRVDGVSMDEARKRMRAEAP